MLNLFIFFYFIVFCFITFLFIHLIYENKVNKDLLFSFIVNFILSTSFCVFLFYFNDYLLSLINSFLLVINTILLVYEIRKSNDRYKLLSIPYLIYIVFIFYLIIDLYLMYL
jgi:tryptophan-rich sensory protein